MIRWLAELQGESFYLEDLPDLFPHGDAYVMVEVGRYFLVGSRLEGLSDGREVNDLANQITDEFAAIAAVFYGHFLRPKVGAIYRERDDGTRSGVHYSVVADCVVRTKMRAKLTDTPGPTTAQILHKAAQSSEHLKTALLLWGDPLKTWPRLYRIVEEVQQHFSTSANKAGLCTKDELKRFEHSANCAETAGTDSRHALRKYKAPTNPMSLADATAFVSGVVRKALERQRSHPLSAV